MKLAIGLLAISAAVIAPVAAAGNSDEAMRKVGEAINDLDRLGRPVPADELLNDAAALCKKDNDDTCLAAVWRAYGYYFRSDALSNWKAAHRDGPSLYDRSVNFNQRFERSVQYYDMSLDLYRKAGNTQWISNIEMQKAFAYHTMGRIEDTCHALQASRDADRKYGDGKAPGPPGTKSFADYIDGLSRATKCPSPESAPASSPSP